MIPSALTIAIGLFALLHIYWLFGGRFGMSAAIPEINGRPAISPSKFVTFFVSVALSTSALLVAALGGLLVLPLPAKLLTNLGYALALVLLFRAVGDFRLVGFFKRIHGTRFSRFDTVLFSPLCLALALGVFLVALRHRA